MGRNRQFVLLSEKHKHIVDSFNFQRIPGHKFVFSLASEVFQKEFTYENENNEKKEQKRSKQVLLSLST